MEGLGFGVENADKQNHHVEVSNLDFMNLGCAR